MKTLMMFAALALAAPAAAFTTPVSLAGLTNSEWGAQAFTTIPTGIVDFGGASFAIDNVGTGARYYRAMGTNPVQLTVPVSIFGATTAYTLINTLWGSSGTYQSVTFNATGGLSATFSLTGNVHVRDFFQNNFSNTINGTTTQLAFGAGPRRIDRQTYVLPAAFARQTLTSVVFTDTGAEELSRMALTGLSIEAGGAAVPEPASWAMLIAGFGLTGAALRRRRSLANA